jgi:hypothetical protein
MATMSKKTKHGNLTGLYFHSHKNDAHAVIHRQGEVLAEIVPGVYLVQLSEWWLEDCIGSERRMVSVQQMLEERWTFHNDASEMKNAHDHHEHRRQALGNAELGR